MTDIQRESIIARVNRTLRNSERVEVKLEKADVECDSARVAKLEKKLEGYAHEISMATDILLTLGYDLRVEWDRDTGRDFATIRER